MTRPSRVPSMFRSAVISSDDLYRYSLERDWGVGTGTVAFVGLNPSTADASVDDATIRVCVGYAQRWGFRRLWMRNLAAYRATDRNQLLTVADPIGPSNNTYLYDLRHATLVVAAWGAGAQLLGDRAAQVEQMLAPLHPHALGFTGSGYPAHPLRQRRDARLVPL